jgi:hypothetical protein
LTVSKCAKAFDPSLSRLDGRHPIRNLGQGFLSFHTGYGRTGSTWNAPKIFPIAANAMRPAPCVIFPLTVSVMVRECGGSIGHREQIITTVLNTQFDGCRTDSRPDGWVNGEQTPRGSSLLWFSDGSVADGGQKLSHIVSPMVLRRSPGAAVASAGSDRHDLNRHD